MIYLRKNKMKNIALVVLFFSIARIGFAQESPASAWTNGHVVVDGNASEWKLPLKYYDNATHLFFALQNDSNNLYLCLQSKDEINQVKILNGGMRITLSNKINGKHKSTISFPLPHKHQTKSDGSSSEVTPDPLAPHESRHALFLATDTTMELKGFANTNGILSIRNSSGIEAAINFDAANTLTYEVAIPLRELFGANYDLKDLSKDIYLNVVINGTQAPFPQQGGFSGRGGQGNGRMGGGEKETLSEEEQNRQSQMQRAIMAQKTELKQRFILAVPK